jgi:hypothetical protein
VSLPFLLSSLISDSIGRVTLAHCEWRKLV